MEYHPQKGHQVKFKLIVTGLFFDSLTRQVDEGQRIQDRKGKLMNSKSEFNPKSRPKIDDIIYKWIIYTFYPAYLIMNLTIEIES